MKSLPSVAAVVLAVMLVAVGGGGGVGVAMVVVLLGGGLAVIAVLVFVMLGDRVAGGEQEYQRDCAYGGQPAWITLRHRHLSGVLPGRSGLSSSES